MNILLPLAMTAGELFPLILMILIWAAFALMNFWIWSKGKATGNLLMLIGSGCISLAYLITGMSDNPGTFMMVWLPVIGAGLILCGFFSTSRPLIAAQLAAIKAKMDSMKDSSDGDAAKDAPADDAAKDSSSES